MTVAVVHNLPPGGARRRLAEQIRHFSTEVIEVCLETAMPVTGDPIVVRLSQRADARPRLLRPPLRYLDLLRVQRAWREAAEWLDRRRVDAIYLNPCRYLQAPPVLARAGIPSLYFCDEPRRVDSEPEARASRNPRTRLLYEPMYRRVRHLDNATVARATRIATNSRYTAAQIRRVYGRSATVVPSGVAPALRAGSQPPGNRDFLLSVGTLIASKGHDLVLAAAARSRARLPVTVVAPRPDPIGAARLRTAAEALGVRLTIRVDISDAELAGLYGAARATLYLAIREPLGLASLEAQACGCPVIVAQEGGLPETVVEGVTGWQVPREASAVAAKLDLLDDLALQAKMAEAARRRGASLGWETSAREIERLLDDIAQRRA